MTTASNSLFATTLLIRPNAGTTRIGTAKTTHQPAAKPAAEIPASLWRHTQDEDAAETCHQRTMGRALAGTAALGLGSVAYALCQAWTLMSGSRLHDAVAAFLR